MLATQVQPTTTVTPTHPAANVQLGDIIANYGSVWQVISRPQYTASGITFEILWLAIADPRINTSTVTFAPDWRFELLDRVAVQPRRLQKVVAAVAIALLLNLASLPAWAGYTPPDYGGPVRTGGSGTR